MTGRPEPQVQAGARATAGGQDDFLEYLGSIGGQLAHLARARRLTFLAFLLDMVAREAWLTLDGGRPRRGGDAG